MGFDFFEREKLGKVLWGMRLKGRSIFQKIGYDLLCGVDFVLDVFFQGQVAVIDLVKYGKTYLKGLLKLVGLKIFLLNEIALYVYLFQYGYQSVKFDVYGVIVGLVFFCYIMIVRQMMEQMVSDVYEREMMYGMFFQRDWNFVYCNVLDRGRSIKLGKSFEVCRVDEYDDDNYLRFFFYYKK